MTVAVIVQARAGSTRLPGKVMQALAGRPVLAHVLERCHAIPGVDAVVCAVPDEATSRPIEDVAMDCSAIVTRGSESDVLDRYRHAAQSVGADIIMRVTSDCPLIDPIICGEVLTLLREERASYACNNMPRTFPHGLDCEAMTIAALLEASELATESYDREHVTPWLRRSPHIIRTNLASENTALANYRWTLDYPEDLDFFRALFSVLPESNRARMQDVLNVLKVYPEIAEINAARGDRLSGPQ